MTDDVLTALAIRAGIWPNLFAYDDFLNGLQRFAALVAAAEREACAKVCEEIEDDYRERESFRYAELKTDAQAGASDCAHRIRARGDA